MHAAESPSMAAGVENRIGPVACASRAANRMRARMRDATARRAALRSALHMKTRQRRAVKRRNNEPLFTDYFFPLSRGRWTLFGKLLAGTCAGHGAQARRP